MAVMTGGKEGHPSFTDQLDETQQYAVAHYVRSLSFTSPGMPAENAAADQAPAGEQASNDQEASGAAGQADKVIKDITFHGKVENATPGGTLPAGLKVVVSAYDGMTPAFDVSGDVDENGEYRVEGVGYDSGYVYIAQVDANGLSFNSDILHGTDISGTEVHLPIQIYETTTDLGALRADRMHIFFDFSQPGVVQVITLYIISNPSGEVVVAPGDSEPVLRFALPEGAMNLQFQDGELGGRYVKTGDGFGDRMGIPPGEGQDQVLFAYTLPYDRKLALDVPLPLPVDAAIVMVPPAGVTLKSDQLMDAGQRDVQGMAYQVYQTAGTLPAGGTLSFALNGRAKTAETASQPSEMNSLLIGAGIFGAVLLGAGVLVIPSAGRSANY